MYPVKGRQKMTPLELFSAPFPPHPNPIQRSDVYSLFGRTHASSHEGTTIATPPCPSLSILDRTHAP
jgi:hypothetical protein